MNYHKCSVEHVEKFKDDISCSSSLDNLIDLPLDEKVAICSTTLKETFSSISPMMQRTVKERCEQQWYNDDLRSLKREKR